MCCWGRPGPRPRAPLHTHIAGCGAWWFRWSAKFCACDSSLPCLQCFRGVRTAARPRTCHMGRGLRANTRDKTRPVHALRRHFRKKPSPTRGSQRFIRERTRPASTETPNLECLARTGRAFSRSRPPSGHAGRINSRTGHSHVAALKPITPLQPLMEASMKPPSPLLTPE